MALLDHLLPQRLTKSAGMDFNHPLANKRMSALAKQTLGIGLNEAAKKPNTDRQRIELIANNPVAFWCVRKIMTAAASVPWIVEDEHGNTVDGHPVAALLANPNSAQSRTEFMQTVVGSLATCGNAYIAPVSSIVEENKMSALFALRPDRVMVQRQTADDSVVTSYDYTTGAGVKRYAPNAVCHIRQSWMLDEVIGFPVIDSTWESSYTFQGFIRLVRKILQNAGGLPGLLVFSSKSQDGLTDEQRKKIESDIARFRLDGDRFGELLLTDVADGDVKFLPLAGTMTGLDQRATKGESAREILLGFGVPPILYMSDDLKYANYQEANRTFWMDTVIPVYLTTIAESLSRFLGVVVRPDLSEVPALSAFNAETLELLSKADFLTIDEKRAKLNYKGVPMGNRIIVNPAAIALDTQMATQDARAVTTIDPQLLLGILQADEATRAQMAGEIAKALSKALVTKPALN